jgi:hypothetical protein
VRTLVPAILERFVNALHGRAWDQVAACLHEDVRFSALIPSGPLAATGRAAAADYLRQWFGDADQLLLLSSHAEAIEDQFHLSYRFRVHEDRWYTVEQQAFCTLRDGQIDRMRLLCSGFCPDNAAGK